MTLFQTGRKMCGCVWRRMPPSSCSLLLRCSQPAPVGHNGGWDIHRVRNPRLPQVRKTVWGPPIFSTRNSQLTIRYLVCVCRCSPQGAYSKGFKPITHQVIHKTPHSLSFPLLTSATSATSATCAWDARPSFHPPPPAVATGRDPTLGGAALPLPSPAPPTWRWHGWSRGGGWVGG